MPIIAINLSPDLYTAVDRTVAGGNYSDLQQFFVVAAQNQLALEASAGWREQPSDSPARPPAPAPETKAAPVARSATPTIDGTPAMLTAVPSDADRELPEPIRLDDAFLWGQINRVLPIAVGVRVLAHLATDREGGVPVTEWHEKATEVATALRPRLRKLDEVAGRRHGSLWSTAFPDDTPASAHRYINQFLGSPKAGLSDGGAALLGFIAFEQEETVATLTTAGAEWASLQNPIFDNGEYPSRTFSIEETQFFINHLKTYRRAELQLLRRIGALVEQGHSRTELDEALAAEYPQWKKYIATMRAGALGRLSDLGFLERTRRGLNVDYSLTPLAKEIGLLHADEDGAE